MNCGAAMKCWRQRLRLDHNMNTGRAQVPRIMELAQRLEADIAKRRLQPGDSYLTLIEAAKMLEVSTATANRALQLLAQRKILIRTQRKGSVIGSLQRQTSPGGLRRVFMFVQRGYLRQEGVVADGVLVGIQSELRGADVQFNFLPETDPAEYVNGLIGEILRGREPAGIVMTKAPFAVQRIVEESGLPGVVHGSLYPSIRRLSSVEQDNRQIARFMADYVISKGCTHVCALTREVIFPGDNIVLAELARLLGEAGLKANAFETAHLPDDLPAMEAEISSMITRHPTGLGLLCRSELKAQAALQAITRLKLKPRQRPTIVVSGLHRRLSGFSDLPYIYPRYEPEPIGAAIGRLLARHAVDATLPPEHILIPVELSLG
jgi:DNA-binding LacI/PurR family transcriptional regulator